MFCTIHIVRSNANDPLRKIVTNSRETRLNQQKQQSSSFNAFSVAFSMPHTTKIKLIVQMRLAAVSTKQRCNAATC